MKLHIGGKETKEGWSILNIQKNEGVDFVGDISKRFERISLFCLLFEFPNHNPDIISVIFFIKIIMENLLLNLFPIKLNFQI